MAADTFLSEFPPVSTQAWDAAIREDLKEADAAKLIWHVAEGLDVKPYYRAEDVADSTFADARADAFPHAGANGAQGGWRIREEIDVCDAEKANLQARSAIAAGGEEIAFCGARIETASD